MHITITLLLLTLTTPALATIEAYPWPNSIAAGEPLNLHVSTTAPTYDLYIIHEGAAPDTVAHLQGLIGEVQTTNSQPWLNGAGWMPSISIPTQPNWTSGIYRIRLLASDGSTRSAVATIRPAVHGSTSSLLLAVPFSTWQAYNNWGGKSLYRFNSTDNIRTSLVSEQRPYGEIESGFTPGHGAAFLDQWLMHLLRWIDREGYAFEICSTNDITENPGLLDAYQTLVLAGHDEYWTRTRREAVESFVASGRHLVVLSGNTCWWQIRRSVDGLITNYRYSEDDPLVDTDPQLTTTNWYRPPLLRPENLLLGASWRNGGYVNWKGTLMAEMGHGGYRVERPGHWIFEGTGLAKGATLGLAHTIVGYETDGMLLVPGSDPPLPTGEDGTPLDTIVLATATSSIDGVEMHTSTMCYREAGGSVFNAATTDWVHGLMDDPLLSRITRNVIDRSNVRVSALRLDLTGERHPGGVALEWTALPGAAWQVEMHRAVDRRAFGLIHSWKQGERPKQWLDTAAPPDVDLRYQIVARAHGQILRSTSIELQASAGTLPLRVFPSLVHGTATVEFGLDRPAEHASLQVVDVRGRRVAELHAADLGAGVQRFTWTGDGLPAGVYFVVLRMDQRVETVRVVLVRE